MRLLEECHIRPGSFLERSGDRCRVRELSDGRGTLQLYPGKPAYNYCTYSAIAVSTVA